MKKRILCLLLAAVAGVTMLSSCGQETSAETQPQAETATNVQEDGQNPVMNFIGRYKSDRCMLRLDAEGDSGAKVTALQTNDAASAADAAQWTLTGEFDEISMRITYTNAVKKLVSYTETGAVSGESVVYQNGTGYIRVNDDGTLTWHDDNDPELASRTFDYVMQEDTQTVSQVQNASAAPSTAAHAATAETAARSATTAKPATTAAQKPTAATTKSSTTSDDGQNPVMNFAGNYQSGRCSLTITPSGKNDATITARWGNSAFSASEWTMHASFNGDTLRLLYGDCVKKTVTYDENGNVTDETVEYTGGVGRLQLFGDGTLRWENEEEPDTFAGMTFSANG